MIEVALAAHLAAVDVELVLLADISSSMNREERLLQREAYIAALRSEGVWWAIKGGKHKAITIAYVEYSGPKQQYMVVAPTRIDSRDDLFRVAKVIERAPDTPGSSTAIGSAMKFGMSLFTGKGRRQVMDVSGDGRNNDGPEPIDVDTGNVEVNGLPLASQDTWLYDYYSQCVSRFGFTFDGTRTSIELAVRRKLVIEISGDYPARFQRAASTVACKLNVPMEYDGL